MSNLKHSLMPFSTQSNKVRRRVSGFLLVAIITTQIAIVPPVFGFSAGKKIPSKPPASTTQDAPIFAQAKQETQAERDARVDSLEITPQNASVVVNEELILSAIVFDKKRMPVGGVALTWRVSKEQGADDASISEQAVFKAGRPGKYDVVVEGAGHTASTSVTVFSTVMEKKGASDLNSVLVDDSQYVWNENNYLSARRPENERGLRLEHPLAANGNFQFTVPVLQTPGRGMGLDLNLTYNSRLWNASGSEVTYDIDKNWPAPGWSFSFPRVVMLGAKGAMIIDADGTRHPFKGEVQPLGNGAYSFDGYTTDGTFIKYRMGPNTNSSAQYPDGTIISFQGGVNSSGLGTFQATMVQDAQGNYISISRDYSPGYDGAIRYIKDELGHYVFFYYDSRKLLTAITTAGPRDDYGNVEMRTLVRLHYKKIRLSYSYTGLAPLVRDPEPYVIDAVYYPSTRTGYWFNDYDSYSFYGMIRKVVQQREMTFNPATSDPDESLSMPGEIVPGQMTSQREYDYPLTASTSLSEAPTFKEVKESWAGMEGSPIITKLDVNLNVSPRTTKITRPDNTYTIQYTENKSSLSELDPAKFRDGLLIREESYSSTGVLLGVRRIVGWELGDFFSARTTRIENIIYNADGGALTSATEISYGAKYNEPIETREYGFDGALISRVDTTFKHLEPLTDNSYHVKLPLTTEVFTGDGTRVSYVINQYDEDQQLAPTPGAVQNFNVFYRRGNVTSAIAYLDPGNFPPTNSITSRLKYDVTGNLISVQANDLQKTSFVFNVNTQYALASSVTSGSSDPGSPVKVTTSSGYDFNTGLTSSQVDSNGRETRFSYDPVNLRASKVLFPTGASVAYSYDDSSLSVATTSYKDGGSSVAQKQLVFLNGIGQTIRAETRIGELAWSVVSTKYDNMNRQSEQSMPYFRGEAPRWTKTTYDDLGRMKTGEGAEGSKTEFFYNEPIATRPLPTGAHAAVGQTVRSVDAWGRERWALMDARGQLIEVVEPNATGNGQIGADGYLSRYSYNSMGLLTEVNQDSQQRRFKYDAFGRVTHEKVAEKAASLDEAGVYNAQGLWSGVYEYDSRSNLIGRTDARGVKTIFSYNNDPLNRLQSVTYNIPADPALRDNSSPIVPAGQVTYSYMAQGDLQRIKQVLTAGVNTTGYQSPGVTEDYSYDVEGRLWQKTETLANAPTQPLTVKYEYDALGRPIDLQYPEQYGTNQARKKVHTDIGSAGQVTGLNVNGVSYASGFEYNSFNQVTSVKIGPDGQYQDVETFDFDADTGLLTGQKVRRGNTTLLNLGYEYLRPGTTLGRTGQITKILNNLDHSRDRRYDYDPLGRLKKVTGGASASWNQQYDYDRFGNRKTVTSSGALAQEHAPNSPQSIVMRELAALTAPPTLASMMSKREGSTETSKLPFDTGEAADPSRSAPANSAAPAAMPAPLQTFDGIYISNNLPATVIANQSANFNVVMRNTGSRTWITSSNSFDGNTELCSYVIAANPGGWHSWAALLPFPGTYPTGANVPYLIQTPLPTRAGTYAAQYQLCRDPSPHSGHYIYFGTASPVILFNVLPSMAYDAIYVSQSIPSVMNSGQTYPVSITVKNNGTQPWTTGSNIALQSVAASFTSVVLDGTRIPVPRQVNPAETFTFEFSIRAPFQPGSYKSKWQMIQGFSNPFGDTTTEQTVTVVYPPDGALFTTQFVPSQMVAGQTYPVSVTMKNTGSSPWTTSVPYRLGSMDPANNTTWGLNRVNLPQASIAPSLDASFDFNVTAPTQLGRYSFQWSMLRDVNGGEVFGETSQQIFVDVLGSTPTPTPTPPPTATPTPRINVALQFNGGMATASSTSFGLPSYTIDGDRIGTYTQHWWSDNTANIFPDWVQVDFNGVKAISEIDVVSLQDNSANTYPPTLQTIFTFQGNTAFEAQYWDQAAQDWRLVPNGAIVNNNRVWKKFTFSEISTSKMRIWITGSMAGTNLVELEAFQYLHPTPTPTPTPSPTPQADQRPFHDQPQFLPGLVESEDFDKGGEGVAYHDSDLGNNGSSYRNDQSVDIEATADSGGGYNVGWLSTDEWLEYSVKVATSGLYKFEARVASANVGRKLRFEFDGVDKTGDMLVPATGGGQSWQTINSYVRLQAGRQVLRVYVTDGGGSFNFNNVRLSAVPASAAPVNLAAGKPAIQSSDYGADYLAPRAADGNTEGNSALRSISSTNLASQSWWEVDLGSSQTIDNIKVWNRTDCCGERLQNFYVFVSDEPFSSNDPSATLATPGVSYIYIPGQGGSLSTLTINRSGRYVRVQLAGTDYLSLAEIEVWGPGAPSSSGLLFDDFNDNFRDPLKWIRMQEGNGVVVNETNHQLEITSDPSNVIYDGYESVDLIDLTDASAAVEVPSGSSVPNQDTKLEIWRDNDNWANFTLNSGSLNMRMFAPAQMGRYWWCRFCETGSVLTESSIRYDPEQHRFWRLRHNISIGEIIFMEWGRSSETLVWETSADGVTWVTQFEVTPGFGLSDLRMRLYSGAAVAAEGPVTFDGEISVFDNFKVAPNHPNHPPAISITAPAAGAVFTSPATIAINASANDSDGVVTKVEFYQGQLKLGETTSAPFNFNWTNVGPGTYSLTAVAFDDLGQSTTTSPVAITVALPVVNVSAAARASEPGTNLAEYGSFTLTRSGSTQLALPVVIELAGTAQSGVDYLAVSNSATIPAGQSSQTVLVRPIDDTLTEGNETVVLTVSNSQSGYRAGSNSVATVEILDNEVMPPSVSITSPAAGASFVPPLANLDISADAADSDGNVTKVEFFAGVQKLGEDTTSPYSYSWANLSSGTYSLTAKATDNQGASTTSSPVGITVKSTNSLSDDFDDNLMDGAKWAKDGSSFVSVAETDQALKIIPASNAIGYNGYYSKPALDLTGGFASVEAVKSTAMVNGNETSYSLVEMTTGNFLQFTVGVAGLQFRQQIDGDMEQQATVPFTASHRFWRFRHDALADTINWDTSPDGITWVTMRSNARPFAITGLQVQLLAGKYSASTIPSSAIFDNFHAERYYTLLEDFNDNVLDLSVWSFLNAGSATAVRELNQQLQIVLQPATVGYFGVRSIGAYDLNHRALQVEIVQPISQAGWVEQSIEAKRDDQNYLHMSAGAGSFVMEITTGGVRDRTTIAFEADNFRFWRFRHNSEDKSIAFETSSNGLNWKTQKVAAVDFSLDQMYIVLQAGAWGTGNSWPGTAIFDNLAIRESDPNQPPAVSLTAPADGAVFTEPAPIDLAADVTDQDGIVSKVEFFQGETKIGEDTTAPFTLQWTGVASGRYRLTAKATDNGGAVTVSAPVNIRVAQPDTIGVYRGATFYLRNSNTSGPANITQAYGNSLWTAVVGDWNGDGTTTLGSFVPEASAFGAPGQSLFALSNSTNSGTQDFTVVFGLAGDIPVVGDWDGNGTDTIGVYRPSNGSFYLRNSNTAGAADLTIAFGATGAIPVAGDWNGDGIDTIGYYSNATFYLRNTNTAGAADISRPYGNAGWKPVVGDWDGNGTTTLGVLVPDASAYGAPGQSIFLLSNSVSNSAADFSVVYGLPGDAPLAGNWNGQLPAVRDTAFVSQAVPSSMTAGRSYDVTVTMRNTGSETWMPEAGYLLGTQNPPDNITWGNTALGFGRVGLSAPVPPNGTATFEFTVTAPAASGSYNFQRAMLVQGAVFGDLTPNVAVTVNALNSISIMATDAIAAEPGVDTGTFTVARSGDTAQALTVSYSLSGSATNGTDYVTLPASVTIPAGAAAQTIVVTPLDDSLAEATESVTVTLTASASYGLGTPASATVSINDKGLGMARPSQFVTWNGITHGIDAGNGTLRNTGGGAASASGSQTLVRGDGYFEATASGYSQQIWIAGANGGSRQIIIGTGGWASIYEDGVEVAATCCSGPIFSPHIPGSRYRFEISGGVLRYVKYVGASRTTLYTSTATLPEYPLSLNANIVNQNTEWQQAVVAQNTQNVTWENVVNGIDLGGGTLRKTSPEAWDFSATPQERLLAGDGYFESTSSSGYWQQISIVGGTEVRTLIIGTGGWAGIYENGVNLADTCCMPNIIPVHLAGDRYRLEVAGGAVRYVLYRGGTRTVMYTSSNPVPTYPIRLQLGSSPLNAEWQNTVIAQTTRVPAWQSIANGIDLGGGTLRKTSPEAWDFSATPQERLLAGDGYFESTSSSGYWQQISIVGGTEVRTLIFGTGGWAGIYENGVNLADTCCMPSIIPVHLAGDRYRLEVAGGAVRYVLYRGGTRTVMYTSSNPVPTYPIRLQLDSSPLNAEWQKTLVRNNLPDYNNAAFVSQTVPSTMLPGQTYPVSLLLKNVGASSWTPDADFRLSSVNAADNQTWGMSRVNLSAAVAPGETATFNYTITAPATPGTYNFQWQMIRERVERFGVATTNVSVIVNNTAPTVSLTAPANNATFSVGTPITLSADASDSDGAVSKVEFFRNGVSIGVDTSSPYTLNWTNAAVGNYAITATATDNLGATSTTAAHNISVVLPVVNLAVTDASASEAGANTGTFTVSRTGDTSAALAVNFALSGTAVSGSDYLSLSTSVIIPAAASSASVVVTPIDDALVEGTETVTLTLSSNAAYTLGSVTSGVVSIADNDTNPPQVAIINPANGATFTAPAIINIEATASDSDGSVAKVEFFQNNNKIGERTAPPFSFAWTSVAAGNYSLTAKATDDSGGVTSSAPINVSVMLPTITIQPTDASASEQGPDNAAFTIFRSGSNSQALTVNFTVGGTATSGTDYSALGSSVVIPAGSSSAVLSVVPIDDAAVEGNETVSLTLASSATYTIGTPSSANVNIADNDTIPPTVSLTAPTAGANFTAPASINLTATAADSDGSVAKVEFFQNGVKIGEDIQTPYSFQWNDVPAGTYSLTARATDNFGAITTSDAVSISVSLPILTITATDAFAAEAGSDVGVFTISRTGNTWSPLVVNVLLAGTAVNGVDYNAVSNPLIIPAGAATLNVTIVPIDDSAFETAETVTLTLANSPVYITGSSQTATITIADNDSPSGVNVALAANGATATASSTHPDPAFNILNAINGSRTPDGGFWNDGTQDAFPDTLEITFAGSKSIDEIDIFSLADNFAAGQPDLALTFTQYGLVDFDVQYWEAGTGTWVLVPGGSVSNNNHVWKQLIFSPITTSKIRLKVLRGVASWSRVVELEAYQATDLALGKPATQSSTANGSSAARAVDGNTNGDLNAGSVTLTNSDAQAWWQTDLGSVQSISSVKLWNRTDCCGDRLTNFHILVSDVPFTSNDLTATINQTGVTDYYVPGAAGVAYVQQIHRTGRYLRVQLAGTNQLSLAEVEVWRDSPSATGCQVTQDIPLGQFIRNFYQAVLGRQPNSSEVQSATNTLTQAYTQGSTQMFAAARSLGDTLFLSPEYAARNRSNRDFVWDLYWAYLPYGPDQAGWNFWTKDVNDHPTNGRANVRYAFDTYPDFQGVVARVCPSTPFTNQLPVSNPGGPYTGNSDSLVQFTSTAIDPDGTISAQQWNFGDELTSVGAGPAHTFGVNGSYPITLMVRDNKGALMSANTTALIEDAPNSTNSAVFVSQSVPQTMNAGQPYTITVTMHNSGTTTWTPQSQHLLGATNPDDNTVWRITGSSDGRVAPLAPVAPGENATFTFEVIAPALPGQRNFQRRMLQHGSSWFGDFTPNIAVTVVGPVTVPQDGVNLTYNEATNRITTSGYEYDREGSLIRATNTEGGWQRIQYDAAGRAVKITDDSGANIVALYTYGESNRRLSATDLSQRTYYCWDEDTVIAEYGELPESPNVLLWSKNYIYLGDSLLAVQEVTSNHTESLKFLHPDTLNTRIVSDVTNNTISEQVTLPFGTALNAESTGSFSRRFTSYDRSVRTGLDYAVNRFYAPHLGRFMQADPTGPSVSDLSNPQSFNLYAYCGNDPINSSDPAGLDFITSYYYSGFGIFSSSGDGRGGIGNFLGGLFRFGLGLFGSIFGGGNRTHIIGLPYMGGPVRPPAPPVKTSFMVSTSITSTETETESAAEPKAEDYSDNTGYKPWVLTNWKGMKAKIEADNKTKTPWQGYYFASGVRMCATLPEDWDYHHENKPMRNTPQWHMGAQLTWGMKLAPGTVAATFNRKLRKYDNDPHGNHTIIFLTWYKDKDGTLGMWVLEQGPNWPPRGRKIPFDSTAIYHSDAGRFNVVLIKDAPKPKPKPKGAGGKRR